LAFPLEEIKGLVTGFKFYLPNVKKVRPSLEVLSPRHFLRQYFPELLIDFYKGREE
jgi:hypothetical protein